jgi:hypothetical protein
MPGFVFAQHLKIVVLGHIDGASHGLVDHDTGGVGERGIRSLDQIDSD